MTLVTETKMHRAGDPEWNRVYDALKPFVAIYAPGAHNKLAKMANAVMRALRSDGTKQPADGSGV